MSGLIADHLAPTIFVLVYAQSIIALVLTGPAAAMVSARRAGQWPDQVIRFVSTLGLGLPPFWLGIVFILLFSLKLGLFPVSGYGEGFLIDHLHHLFLGALTMALALGPGADPQPAGRA